MKEMIPLIVLINLLILILIYLYIKRKQSYWCWLSNSRIPYERPEFFYGQITEGIFEQSKQLPFQLQEFYRKFKGRGQFGGLYYLIKPIILAIDLNFIKCILIKDFNYFVNRGIYHNERDDPLTKNVYAIDGEKWTLLRKKLTATFSPGKMKFIFPTMIDVSQNLERCLHNAIRIDEGVIEMREIFERFSTDVICTCVYGYNCNSLTYSNADFRQMVKKIFSHTPNTYTKIKRALVLFFKDFSKYYFHIKFLNNEVSQFFQKCIRESIVYREKNHIKRKDLLDHFMKLKKDGDADDDDDASAAMRKEIEINVGIINECDRLTLKEIAAQAFLFYHIGFEKCTSTLSFCLYELALNKEIQTKARNDIYRILHKYNEEFTYEAMLEMFYIDQIINETLRKYPPIGNVVRITTKDYYVQDLKYTIRKNTKIFIPVYAIHHDPDYYMDPERFRPERFEHQRFIKRNPMTFLPFGDGPRNCIGLRFGIMQIRIALIVLLKKFEFVPSARLIVPIALTTKNTVLSSVNDIYLRVKEI